VAASQLSITFFLQMAVILGTCWCVGTLATRIGQPRVVGEMIAGVLLGPSLFGLLWPEGQAFLFPADSLKTLYVGAQLGVGLYMFLVGLEFRVELLRSKARSAVFVSGAGVLVPFTLAVALAPWLMGTPGLFSPQTSLGNAVLFLGAAIAITAFPMLARIIHERGITGTALGTLALSAGAVDDAAAWCVLALVLATFNGHPIDAVWTLVGCVAYLGLVMTVGRRLLARLGERVEAEGQMSNGVLAFVLGLLMLGAWSMDALGVHAVFGGFALGVAMPDGLIARELKRKLESFAVVFLLPMFFVYSGLNTRLDILTSMSLVGISLAVLAASFVGKGVACWAAARLSGETNRTAMAVGALMNARGLMELIIVNIGLQKGVIQPALFSMLVLMAIVSTLMASPLFEWIYRKRTGESTDEPQASALATAPTG
jgi:Kef-type K+ transport system membrane component KefB